MVQADSVAPPRALGDHDSLSNKQDILFLSWKKEKNMPFYPPYTHQFNPDYLNPRYTSGLHFDNILSFLRKGLWVQLWDHEDHTERDRNISGPVFNHETQSQTEIGLP